MITVNIDGVERTVPVPQVNINGVWKTVDVVSNNIDGVWRESYPIELIVTADNRSMVEYTGVENEELVIPDVCTGEDGMRYKPIVIDSSAFANCSNLTSVYISNNITAINYNAFNGCSSLSSITLSNNIFKIDYGTFQNCTSLTTLIIPENVTAIDSNAFMGSGLTSIIIPNNVKTIGSSAFQACESLESVVIGDGIVDLSQYAVFRYCTNLKHVEFGKSVAVISQHAFGNCGFESLFIPANITTLSSSAFSSCANLTSVIIGENNSEYELDFSHSGDPFNGCENIKSVVLRDSVTTLNAQLFYHSKNSLEAIVLSNSITEIPYSMFSDCVALNTVTIGSNINTIYNQAFQNCSSLMTVNYRGTQEEWDMITIAEDNDYLLNATINYNYID